MDNLETKWLSGSDLNTLNPIIDSMGWSRITEGVAVAAVLDGVVIGFLALQKFAIAGPMWVAKDYRGSGIPDSLSVAMLQFMASATVSNYIVVADNPAIAKLCEGLGMEKITSPVYIKRVDRMKKPC